MAEPERPEQRSESHVLAERREKLERLRAEGIEPVPARISTAGRRSPSSTPPTTASSDGEETEAAYRVAGRIAARRGHGKAAFLDLVDGSGRIQLHARADVLGERRARAADRRSTSATSSASRAPRSRPAAASSRCGSPAGRCSRRACARRPTSSTASRTPRLRYRHRELDLIANAETRELFIAARATIAAVRALARRARASSRSRRPSCSRSTAARWRDRSQPTTTRSTATSTCGSPPSSTSSG